MLAEVPIKILMKHLHWYFQSAQSGNVKALMNLGLMYLTGKGTNKDIVQAHKFLTISEI